MTTINAVGNGLAGATGTGNFVGSTSPSLTTPTIGVATATSINFGGSALSSYIENTSFTPTITFATPGDLSVSYASQSGHYTRIGNLVTYTFVVVFTPTYTTASGALRISIPIASNSTELAFGTCFYSTSAFPAGTSAPFIFVPSNVSYLQIQTTGSSTAAANITTTEVTSGLGNLNIYGTVTYFV